MEGLGARISVLEVPSAASLIAPGSDGRRAELIPRGLAQRVPPIPEQTLANGAFQTSNTTFQVGSQYPRHNHNDHGYMDERHERLS